MWVASPEAFEPVDGTYPPDWDDLPRVIYQDDEIINRTQGAFYTTTTSGGKLLVQRYNRHTAEWHRVIDPELIDHVARIVGLKL